MLLTPAEIKPKPFESRRNSFLSGADVLQIYVRASTLCRFHSHSLSGTTTPSIAFRHLPSNSAKTGYATEGALFISAQLSTDAVSALRISDCGSNLVLRHPRKHETESSVSTDSNDFGFTICAGVSNVVSYKRNV